MKFIGYILIMLNNSTTGYKMTKLEFTRYTKDISNKGKKVFICHQFLKISSLDYYWVKFQAQGKNYSISDILVEGLIMAQNMEEL